MFVRIVKRTGIYIDERFVKFISNGIFCSIGAELFLLHNTKLRWMLLIQKRSRKKNKNTQQKMFGFWAILFKILFSSTSLSLQRFLQVKNSISCLIQGSIMLRRAGQKGSVLFGAAAAQTRSTWLPSSVLSSSLPRRWLTSAEHASPPLSPDLPSEAKVVVVGGGVIGASVAYHLTHMGCKDVVLLERDQLTSGTTWHAAGLMVTFGSCSETSTEFRKYTRDLYSRLEAETGQSTGFMPVGFIELAEGKDRLIEFRRVAVPSPGIRLASLLCLTALPHPHIHAGTLFLLLLLYLCRTQL
eukprot:g23583.t1